MKNKFFGLIVLASLVFGASTSMASGEIGAILCSLGYGCPSKAPAGPSYEFAIKNSPLYPLVQQVYQEHGLFLGTNFNNFMTHFFKVQNNHSFQVSDSGYGVYSTLNFRVLRVGVNKNIDLRCFEYEANVTATNVGPSEETLYSNSVIGFACEYTADSSQVGKLFVEVPEDHIHWFN